MTSYLKGKSYEEIYGEEKSQQLKENKSKSARKSFFYQVEENLNKMNLLLMDDSYEGPEFFHNFICLVCGEEMNTTYKKIKKAKYTCNFCLFNKKDGILDENIHGDLVRRNRYELWKEYILPKLLEKEKVDFIIKRLKEDLNYLMDYIIEDTNFLDENSQIGQRLYHIYHGLYEIPKCEVCEKEYVRFSGFYKGYQTYCSQYCGGKAKGKNKLNKESRQKLSKNMKNTFEERGNEIIEQRKKTYFEKTGYYHQMHNPEVKKKKQLSLGTTSPLKLESVRNKVSQTHKNKRNDPVIGREIKEKTQKTNLERYGETHWSKTRDGKAYLREKKLIDGLYKYDILKEMQLEYADNFEYQNAHYYHNWRCNRCGDLFKTCWNNIREGYLCPTCFPRTANTSVYEKEIYKFIYNLGFTDAEENNRTIINPKELDIFIPSINTAIEFNGLYWHSEEMGRVDKNYHLDKTNECLNKGVNLIQIFEDEWVKKQKLVRERLKNILGKNNNKIKIYGRNCYIKEVDNKTKNEFLNEFHLQGGDISPIRLGAFYNDKLVGVMTFSKGKISKGSKSNKNIWELSRFCTDYNYNCIGLGGKLLNYFKNNYKWEKIFTYADKRWSNGDLYYTLGFKYTGDTKPNYWYIDLNKPKRIHRFALRKRENSNLTEHEIRRQEGYYRIWDCGNMKFEMINE